ncbi:peptidase M28 [Salinimicrobium marinum]|uniref:Peptidase M28 n=1 Tax=Salinimicrobium marinum TaxID=680283 RepID=A0A918W0H6_9FLAO|nr:M28 family peptidase [Salinimicrobium marinum]GHA40667.1 peptidase M28 [Salinimicrobium marinum]
MRKNILSVFFLFTCSLFLSCGQPKEVAEKESGSENFSGEVSVVESEVSETLQYLASDELQGRNTGSEGIEKAAVYIENIFRKNNIKPYFETYRDSFETKGTTGYNVVGFKEGKDPQLKDEFIIIGAHYDHIGQGETVGNDSLANGANDNASGTTAVLELAKYFADMDTKRSILFTLYSAEELGLVGSSHLAQKLSGENIDLYVMFNIEMIGVPMKDKSYSAYLTGYELSNLAEKFNEYAGAEVVGFLPQAKEYSLFRRSDNYPFYQEFEIPAQTISTFDFTNYEYYHHVDDEFELMDAGHMTKLIEEIIPGIARMANTPTKEIKMNE